MSRQGLLVTGTAATALRWRPLSRRAPRQFVVLCHGLGGDAHQLAPCVPSWQAAAPDAMFVAPCAPQQRRRGLREILSPRGIPRGHQWFSIDRESPAAIEAGLRRAASWLDRFIDTERTALGIEGAPYVLIGFSQGAMVSLFTGLRRADPPAAILGFAGALLAPDRFPAELRNRAPVFLVHGEADHVVKFSASVAARDVLTRCGVPVELVGCPALGHVMGPESTEIGARRLAQVLA